MNAIKGVFSFVFGIIFLGVLFFIGSDTMITPPSNAIVVLKHDSQTILAPPCIDKDFTIENDPNYSVSRLKEARKLQYKADNCSENALYPTRSTILHYTLEKIKILKPLYRWDKDGNWLY